MGVWIGDVLFGYMFVKVDWSVDCFYDCVWVSVEMVVLYLVWGFCYVGGFMWKLKLLMFYMVFVLVVNGVVVDIIDLDGFLVGDMVWLIVYIDFKLVDLVEFEVEDGGDMILVDINGKLCVVNFWVIWCGFCCVEMFLLLVL